MGDLSLVIFTIFLQAAVGVMLFMAFVQQKLKETTFKKAAYASALLAVIGVIFSLGHLGQPLYAFNSLFNLGTSWLSNEIFFTGIFTAIAVVYAVLLKIKPVNNSLNNGFLWAGSIVGLLAVFSMARVYTFTAIPAWNSPNVYVDFFAAAVAMGGVIFWVLSTRHLKETDSLSLAVVILFAVIVQVALSAPYLVGLALEGGASAVSAAIISDMSSIMVFSWIFVLGGSGALMLPSVIGSKSVNSLYSAAVLIILGQALARYIFYASGVVPGIGV